MEKLFITNSIESFLDWNKDKLNNICMIKKVIKTFNNLIPGFMKFYSKNSISKIVHDYFFTKNKDINWHNDVKFIIIFYCYFLEVHNKKSNINTINLETEIIGLSKNFKKNILDLLLLELMREFWWDDWNNILYNFIYDLSTKFKLKKTNDFWNKNLNFEYNKEKEIDLKEKEKVSESNLEKKFESNISFDSLTFNDHKNYNVNIISKKITKQTNSETNNLISKFNKKIKLIESLKNNKGKKNRSNIKSHLNKYIVKNSINKNNKSLFLNHFSNKSEIDKLLVNFNTNQEESKEDIYNDNTIIENDLDSQSNYYLSDIKLD